MQPCMRACMHACITTLYGVPLQHLLMLLHRYLILSLYCTNAEFALLHGSCPASCCFRMMTVRLSYVTAIMQNRLSHPPMSKSMPMRLFGKYVDQTGSRVEGSALYSLHQGHSHSKFNNFPREVGWEALLTTSWDFNVMFMAIQTSESLTTSIP